jgi:tRNA/tmRNA/rRNA uracil-C5-methylase (TrmA/RlmC/RlmD family)
MFMSTNDATEEVFDEEELADGFDEEIVGEEELEDADIEGDGVIEIDDEEILVEIAVPEEEEDVADDADVELAEVDTTIDPTETILPKQDDEFRCDSCRLLKKTSQLADKDKMLCRDCV